MKKFSWIIIIALALIAGFIPFTYLIWDQSEGFLQLKSEALLKSIAWNIGFYFHIFSGTVAISTGWIQFNKKVLNKRAQLHRAIGKLYVLSALISSMAAIFIGFYAYGGWVARTGFIIIAFIFFYSTLKGFMFIKQKKFIQHKQAMTYSYAACLGAVTLRIYIPLGILCVDDYLTAYKIAAWLSWIPNLLIAYSINKNNGQAMPGLKYNTIQNTV